MGHMHGHGHGDDEWPEVWGSPEAGIRRWLVVVAAAALVLAVCGLVAWWPGGDGKVDREVLGFAERVNATVTSASDEPCSFDPATRCRVVDFRVDATGEPGRQETPLDAGTPTAHLDEGDKVILSDAGTEVPPESRYSFADRQRGGPLVLLAVLFAGAVVALGRLRGLLALVGVGFTFAVLLWFLLPALLSGAPPVGVALTGATLIAFGTLYLAHGVNERTTVALVGTLASLALTAVLAIAFAGAAELSGLASEESLALLTAAPGLDFRGLLLAAVIIGALGVLDDVTVTQVAAVTELRRSDPSASRAQLISAGTRIGRDHIASTVNTLILAYSAAALPLVLIYSQSGLGLGAVLTTETIAVEVVQTLVGSIGLVASVPLTTALAAWVVTAARPAADPEAVPEADEPEWMAPQPAPPPEQAWAHPPAEGPAPWYAPSAAETGPAAHDQPWWLDPPQGPRRPAPADPVRRQPPPRPSRRPGGDWPYDIRDGRSS